MTDEYDDIPENALISSNRQELELPGESKHELTVRNIEALEDLADGVCAISNFICNGGLTQVLSGYARTQAVKDILGGLAAHDGRKALDARVLPQNALEIVEQVEAVFRKYTERAQESNRDPEIKRAKE